MEYLSFRQFSEKATLGERAAQGKVVCNSCNTQISDFYLSQRVPMEDCVLCIISLSTVDEYVIIPGSFWEDAVLGNTSSV